MPLDSWKLSQKRRNLSWVRRMARWGWACSADRQPPVAKGEDKQSRNRTILGYRMVEKWQVDGKREKKRTKYESSYMAKKDRPCLQTTRKVGVTCAWGVTCASWSSEQKWSREGGGLTQGPQKGTYPWVQGRRPRTELQPWWRDEGRGCPGNSSWHLIQGDSGWSWGRIIQKANTLERL